MTVASSWRWRFEALNAIALSLLGLVVWWAGNSIPPSFMDTGFGAGMLPKGLGGLLILLSLTLLVEVIRAGRRTKKIDDSPEDARDFEDQLSHWDKLKPYAVVALMVAVLINADFRFIPFYLSVAIFIFTVIVLLEGGGKRALVIASSVSVAMTLLVWIVFTQLFMVIIQ